MGLPVSSPEEVLRTSNWDRNSPSQSTLVMLFLFGFAYHHMNAVDDSEADWLPNCKLEIM